MTLPRHRTARERAAQASAQQAIARAWARATPPPPPAQDDDAELGRLYPYVTPARARAIRHEIEETRRHA